MHPLEQAVHPPKRFSIKMEYPFHVGASSVSLAPIFYASQKKRSALTPLLLLSKPKPKALVWAAERNHRAFLLKVDPDKSGFVGGMPQ